MQSEILGLLEGLTPSQVKEFRRRIVPALENIRQEVITMQQDEQLKQPHTPPRSRSMSAVKVSRGNNHAM